MGCDIHLWVETRAHADAPWQLRAPEFRCCWCKGRGYIWVATEPCYFCAGGRTVTRFDVRDYLLFAMLAGVRNNHDVAPISEPRGLPPDASDALCTLLGRSMLEEAPYQKPAVPGREHAYPGDHSGSWVTVAEIDRYLDAPRTVTLTGVVALETYRLGWPDVFYAARERIEQGLIPEQKSGLDVSYSHSIWGPGITTIDEALAKQLIAAGAPTDPGMYVQATWNKPLVDVVSADFVRHFLPACRALAPRSRNVRLVFNFDS